MAFEWDSPNITWDSGLTWDAGQSPNPGDVTPYLNLVTSEHRYKPNYIAMLTEFLQPIADGIAVANSLVPMFDIDTAEGQQLDAVGLWVGVSRYLSVPITDVYLTFDDGPGLDMGIFWGPFEPINELIALPDASYRILLYATVAANHWDGTIGGAYEAYAIIFGPGGYRLVIVDNQDMSMDLILSGPIPDAVTLALFRGGYLSLKPVGVRVRNYIVSANPAAKIFMFDAAPDSPAVGGFDTAAFPTFYEGT